MKIQGTKEELIEFRELLVNSKLEKLRKDVKWELQRHIKNEYTIFQSKRRINELFKKALEIGEIRK